MTILELRQKTGLSQSQFAKRFHLNVRTVQTWEQGTRKTPDYVIWLITKVIELEEIVNAKRDGI
ncbi:putative transcriptional regulator [Oribacterium sp. KHPX15]|uniref:helix-turn-helix domain-containing protein n=1 Tax=unclassified Oribacterium TaxID=2629782 RepID=UPI0005D27F0D|nr:MULTISPECIES: helix-turn-helix domain-containing protein [unclassified Oribacterium]SEA75390.1 putative transcriptional regulator [Oribacterium sp. KHPX15]SEA93760.1 putative transcriptional regulator [Oribacterium sp. KHPX15]